MKRAPLLVYGGTFDPVHRGHVLVARTAADRLAATRVLLLPCGDPPHRSPAQASGRQRAAMLRLAFADDARFVVDERELRRQGRSYSVDTLRELRLELGPEQPIVMLLGRDAALGLASWHQASALAALCHLLVAERAGNGSERDMVQALGWRPLADPAALADSAAGGWASIIEPLSAASSTAVRSDQAARQSDLPLAVADYIEAHQLYR